MKDYLLLFDKDEKLKRIINNYEFFKDEYRTTVKGEVVFEFRIKDTLTDIVKEDKIGIFKEDGSIDLLIVDQIESETIYSTEYKVTCLHDFYSIQEEKAITQWESKSISIKDAVTQMLEGTSYELGECVERASIALGPYLFKNVLWCIQDIINEFGVEVKYSIELDSTRTKISKKKLHIVNALGSDTGIRCSTDLNVSKIKSVEKNKFYTVLYGCGSEYQKDLVKYKYSFKDIESTEPLKPKGQEYVEDKEAIEKYGRKIGIFEDGRIKDPKLLLKYTWEALKKNNKPLVNYEMEIHDLKTEDGYEHLDFKLGDLIVLHNTIDDSRAKFRIVEYARQVSNPKNVKITIGEQIKGITGGNGNSNGNLGGDNGGTIIDPDEPDLDDSVPDTLPPIPVAEAFGLWSMVSLSWTYENKMYYTYEVYASKIKDFEPTVFNLIFTGKTSAYLHEVKPKETWYYKVRAINTHGSTTEFSEQIEATTSKLSDAAQYFEEAAIKDALIGELRLDRGWVGELKGHYIDARNLSVTDGNNKKTFQVSTNGNVSINGIIQSDDIIMANGGIYTNQAVRGRNASGTVFVGTYGTTVLRADAGEVYLQTDTEAKVTGATDPNTFKDLRANTIAAESDLFARGSVFAGNNGAFVARWGYGVVRVEAAGQPLYLQCNNEVKCTKTGDPNTFIGLRAENLMAQNKVYANGVALTSSIEHKKNIEDYTESALYEICDTPIRKYHLDCDLDEELKRVGIILQEAPLNAIDLEGTGVDLYQMIAMSWKAIQELKIENDTLKEEIKQMKEGAINA